MQPAKTKSIIIFSLIFMNFTLTHAQKIETVDGVKVVHNGTQGEWGDDPDLTLEFVRTIGELESDDENVLFHMPADIAFDAEGNIYILDAGNHRIQKFNPDGQFLASFGNKGQGPGEFQFPLSLDIDADGSMYVPDAGNQRLQILSPQGKDQKIIPMHDSSVGFTRLFTPGLFIQGGGGFMIMGPGDMEDDAALPGIFKVFNMEGKPTAEFGAQHDYKEMMTNRMGNQVKFAVDGNHNVYVAFNYQNRIEKYSPEGKLLWRADRKLNYDTKAPVKKGRREGSGGYMTIEAPQMNQCSNGIAVDDQGRIWVVNFKRQIKEDERVRMNMQISAGPSGRSMSMSAQGNTDVRETDMYQLDVYAPGGVLLGSFPLTHFADDIRIDKDRIFLLDKLRGAQYYQYRIVE